MSDGGNNGGSHIVAIVTARADKITGGGVPVFSVEDEQKRERVAILLAKMLRAMVHDLEDGTYVIVRH